MWWIVTSDVKTGAPLLRGPYPSQYRAQVMLDNQGVSGEVVSLPTKDPARATRMLKEKRIEEFGLEEGVKRFRHK